MTGVSRVAMFHTEYTHAGGEDVSTRMDAALLQQRGITVVPFGASNRDALAASRSAAAYALLHSPFNPAVYERVRAFCRTHRPDVAHVQNFWFALSPSVHAACHAEGVPTIQTLRNYRLLCVNAQLLRDGRPCEDCVGHGPWRGVLHACYRQSRLSSALVARMIQYNRRRRTWDDDVDLFIALTPFARDRHVAGGLPADRIVVRPNSVHDPGVAAAAGRGAVFVGRLSDDKGVDLLVEAWKTIPDVPLTIVGDGPLRDHVASAASRLPNIRVAGPLANDAALEAMRSASIVVMASRWYEGFPRVIVEAFAVGRPVVAPRLGSMSDVVSSGVTGLLFEPGSAAALAGAVRSLVDNPEMRETMARAARAEYERLYLPEKNGGELVAIYEEARRRYASRR